MKYPKVDGYYMIDGEKFKLLTGSRAQVWHKTAYKTTGGLLKSDLVQNKHGDIVSKKKHEQETKDSNLIKHGYGYKNDGTFGYEKIKGAVGITARASRRMKTTKKLVQQGGGHMVADNTIPGIASTAAQFGGGRRRSHKRHHHHMGGGSDTISPDTLYGGRRRKRTAHARRGASSSMLAGGYTDTSNLFL